jgi:hypothetical protein
VRPHFVDSSVLNSISGATAIGHAKYLNDLKWMQIDRYAITETMHSMIAMMVISPFWTDSGVEWKRIWREAYHRDGVAS